MEQTVQEDQPVSYTLLHAVAEVEGCSPTDLPPLQETLDVDALDALFAGETDTPSQFEGRLTFEYSDCSVTISVDRSVTVSIAS